LTELYNVDHKTSKKLVTRPLETWHGTSVFKLADDADSMDIKTHDCFQAVLDDTWRGQLSTNYAAWKVTLLVHVLSLNKRNLS